MDIETIRSIEEALWFDGADAYQEHLAPQALVVVPGAALDRDATISAIAQAPRWAKLERSDEQVVTLAADCLLLHYRASAERADGSGYEALVSSIYSTDGDLAHLVFHQQTPRP